MNESQTKDWRKVSGVVFANRAWETMHDKLVNIGFRPEDPGVSAFVSEYSGLPRSTYHLLFFFLFCFF